MNSLQKSLQNNVNCKPLIRKKCLACNKTFASSSSLSTHKKRCKGANCKHGELKSSKNTDFNENLTGNTPKTSVTSSFSSKPSKLTQSYPIVNPNICNFCSRDNFSSIQSLSRHMKSCGLKVKMEQENALLKQKVELLEKEKEEWKRDKEHLYKDKEAINKDKDIFANIAVTNTNTVNNSVSAMKYLMANFKNTPALEPIKDLSSLKVEYLNDTSFILQLLYKYKHGLLTAFIGDYIVNIYKQVADLSKQAIWSSDVDRLTYIISEAVAKNKTTWITDKRGLIFGERIVRPALDYIKPLLITYIQECNREIMNNDTSASRCTQILEYQKLASNVGVDIDNMMLEKDIVKYIAPKLYWNKNMLIEEDNSNNSNNSNNKKLIV